MVSRISRGGAVALLAAAAAAAVSSCVVSAQVPPGYPASGGLEWNVNRRGADYRSFDLVTPSPETCQQACMNEPQCMAFTYVNPGVQGPSARCWLKGGAPEPQPDSCCVSGVKYAPGPPQATPPEPAPAPPPPPQAAPPQSGWQGAPMTPPPPAGRQWEPNTDRPGGDYRSFDLREPRPEHCREACWHEGQCRAFTYVRPGVQGPNARCWLKSDVPQARPNDCCLSGVR
jgi:hypothetical protein